MKDGVDELHPFLILALDTG